MIDRLRRLSLIARAIRAGRELGSHDAWSIEQLRAHQRARLLAIIRHAAAHSPYYRERFAGIELSDDLELAALPRLDKATMLENFDDLVTDRRLTLAGLEAHLAELGRARPHADPTLFGEYRAMASGGSSGRRGVFVYGREDWIELLGGIARSNRRYVGSRTGLPRMRLATVWAEGAQYIGGRVLRSLDAGPLSPYRQQRLDARMPLDELVEALNDFQPEALNAYASTAALLAEQQLTGALDIAPKTVVTIAEVRTSEMEQRMAAAWGTAPFNSYGSTETGPALAFECDRHAGLHLFEDVVQAEIVDEDYRPVATGEPGSRLLVTNLYNHTQPLIRYELNDLVTLSPEPCPCGRPFPLLTSVDGRCDDIVELPATTGGTISIHPSTLRRPMIGITAISEYRILHQPGELRVEAVLRGPNEGTCEEIRDRLGAELTSRGVQAPPIRVERVDQIPRNSHSGKHKAIEVLPQGDQP